MLTPSDFIALAIALFATSVFFLYQSRAVLAQFHIWRQVSTLWQLLRALLPLWFVQELVRAQKSGQSTRLLLKRYRSLRRRALERTVEEFFETTEPKAADRARFAWGMLCAMAGGMTLLVIAAARSA